MYVNRECDLSCKALRVVNKTREALESSYARFKNKSVCMNGSCMRPMRWRKFGDIQDLMAEGQNSTWEILSLDLLDGLL